MPVLLIDFGGFYLFTYGVLISVGLLTAGFVFWRELRHTSWDEDVCFALVIKSLIWAFIIARLIQVQFLTPSANWREFFNWRQYPGVNGFIVWLLFWLLSWYQAVKLKLDTWRFLDILSWVSLIFYFWLSLACWSGSCWLGRSFSYGWPVIGSRELVLPVSFFHLIMVLSLMFIISRWRLKFKVISWYKSARYGFVFWLAQSVYALLRALVVDSLNQPGSISVLGLSLDFYFWLTAGLIGLVIFWFWAGYHLPIDIGFDKMKRYYKVLVNLKKGKNR